MTAFPGDLRNRVLAGWTGRMDVAKCPGSASGARRGARPCGPSPLPAKPRARIADSARVIAHEPRSGAFLIARRPNPRWPSGSPRSTRNFPAARVHGGVRRTPDAVRHRGPVMSEIVQVSLRGTRREFYLNSRNLWLRLRDRVIVQGEHGESLGTVHLKDPTLIQLKRPGNVTREIIRKAEEEDLDQEDQNRTLESEAFDYCQQRIELRELKM